MKTLLTTFCFVLITYSITAQISIDSVRVNTLSNPDSFYISMRMPELDFEKVEFVSLNDAANTQAYSFYFTGCPISQLLIKFDTTISINSPPPYRLVIYAIYDTIPNCPNPQQPIVSDSIILSSSQILSVEEVGLDETLIRISPNPVKDVLKVEIDQNIRIENIMLLNSLGQTLKTYSKTKRSIDVSSFNSGTYFLKITSPKEDFIKKVVLSRE